MHAITTRFTLVNGEFSKRISPFLSSTQFKLARRRYFKGLVEIIFVLGSTSHKALRRYLHDVARRGEASFFDLPIKRIISSWVKLVHPVAMRSWRRSVERDRVVGGGEGSISSTSKVRRRSRLTGNRVRRKKGNEGGRKFAGNRERRMKLGWENSSE